MSESFFPVIWFALWGLLWAIYFALDGFDLGAGMLSGVLPTAEERRALLATLGPFWDGNEVWLITAGGVTFAAFPALYATMFSSLYVPLLLILLSLVLRAAAIEFFQQSVNPGWQRFWASVLSAASLLIPLLFGVAFGNIFQGLPIDEKGYHGSLPSLLNPYGLLTGLLFVLAFLYNGGAWMAHKTEGSPREKGYAYAHKLWLPLFVVAALFLVATPFATDLLQNYLEQPLWFLTPLAAVACLVASRVLLDAKKAGTALIAGSLAVLAIVLAGIIGLFPGMFPSSIDPKYGLTAFNASGSPYTLRIMLIVTAVFLPLVLLYQVWFYALFSRKGPANDAQSDY